MQFHQNLIDMKTMMLAAGLLMGAISLNSCSSSCNNETTTLNFANSVTALSTALGSQDCNTINTKLSEMTTAYNALCDDVKPSFTAQYETTVTSVQSVLSDLGC
jgi:hypothetical protein